MSEEEPATLVPNRLLARLLEYDSCEHAPDYVCGPCGTAARDAAIALLEGPHWSDTYIRCCEHCGCAPNERWGHDDTCSHGCNDLPVTLPAISR